MIMGDKFFFEGNAKDENNFIKGKLFSYVYKYEYNGEFRGKC